jgi:hypothetical protein
LVRCITAEQRYSSWGGTVNEAILRTPGVTVTMSGAVRSRSGPQHVPDFNTD